MLDRQEPDHPGPWRPPQDSGLLQRHGQMLEDLEWESGLLTCALHHTGCNTKQTGGPSEWAWGVGMGIGLDATAAIQATATSLKRWR